jgi:hypothetical protein
MKKEVFQKLNSHPAVKPYKNDIGLDPKFDKHLKTYFDTAVRQGRYYSEDWTFCENWRDLGGKVWVDKRVLLRHSGSYVFCMENQDHLLNTIGPMYVEELKKRQSAEQQNPIPAVAAQVDATPTAAKAKKAASKK